MADNGFRPAPPPKNVFDEPKLDLKALNAKGKMATLKWGLVRNNKTNSLNPRLTVYTNDPEDTVDNGRISANLDVKTFFAFLNVLSRAVKSDKPYKVKIDNKNFTFPGGKRSEEPTVVSSLWVGRDEDGTVWISITAPRHPSIRFPFVNPDFHYFYNANGEQFTNAEYSSVYAEAYIAMLAPLMTTALNTLYKEPPPREDNPQQGGNRGGYQGGGNRQGGGGGYGGGGGGNRQGGYGGGQGGGGGAPRAPVEADTELAGMTEGWGN